MKSFNEGKQLYTVNIEDSEVVVRADSRAQAKMKVVLSWRDAGYGSGRNWPLSLRARERNFL
jgi:hypothetical protein